MITSQLSDFVDMDNPQAVLEEVLFLLADVFPGTDYSDLERVHADILKLFQGRYPGFQACNTYFHDFKHTSDCLLAMIRLIHGAMSTDMVFQQRDVLLSLITAMMHDTGYVQHEGDHLGTGAKFTLTHVQRSIDFMETYYHLAGYSRDDFLFSKAILLCTGLDVNLDKVHFVSADNAVLGSMLGTADLLGQMGDRDYLEKIVYLYHEFEEGQVPGFESEFDLLQKTPQFYAYCKTRFETDLGGVFHYMRGHFRRRWGLDHNLYVHEIDNKIRYLKQVVLHHPQDYRHFLKRKNSMQALQDAYPQRQ
ncbi:MAG: hypothetical protein K9J81_07605 [Desulfohalobiaceae bacterium]|nr:hypothetical protein [Desulfohalobiaceae bacterium]